MQNVISMNYSSSTSSWQPWRWVRLDLIFQFLTINSTLNPHIKVTSSRKSTKFKDILSGHISRIITKAVPVSTRIVISYAMKQGILLWIWWKVNGNWDNNMIRISQWRESHCRRNTGIRRKKSKRAGLWESQSGIQVGKLTIWVRSFEIVTAFNRLISSTRIGKSFLMMNVKDSKDKNMSRWVDWEKIIYIRWNRIKHCAQRWRRWSIEEKEVRCWVK